MLHMLIENLMLGFVITAVPGAVFFETIHRSIFHKTSLPAFMAGNFAGMFLIIGSVLAGISSLLADKTYFKAFYALSGLVLLYIGGSSFMSKRSHPEISGYRKHERSQYSALLTGFILAAANPISILFWISMSGKMFQQDMSAAGVMANCASIVAGASLVFIILIAVFSRARFRLKAQQFIILSKSFGVIICIYGVTTLAKIL